MTRLEEIQEHHKRINQSSNIPYYPYKLMDYLISRVGAAQKLAEALKKISDEDIDNIAGQSAVIADEALEEWERGK